MGSIEAYVDKCEVNSISGWGWNSENPDESIIVELLNNQKMVISSTFAQLHRSDLKEAGLGSGNYGFTFNGYLQNAAFIQFRSRDAANCQQPIVMSSNVLSNYFAFDSTNDNNLQEVINGWLTSARETEDSSEVVVDASQVTNNANAIPSVWRGNYYYRKEFINDFDWRAFTLVMKGIDDREIPSTKPFEAFAYCDACHKITKIQFRFEVGVLVGGSVQNAWSETGICEKCKLPSRVRVIFDVLNNLIVPKPVETTRIYVAEAITPFFKELSKQFNHVIGSEFLGSEKTSGVEYQFDNHYVQHQDLTKLSFEGASFEIVITNAVFEHVYDYQSAFRECYRVLSDFGSLVFTIPFSYNKSKTVNRAILHSDGSIEHTVLPPEIHDNPVGDGALCFHNFSWDILDDLRETGFGDVSVHQYWGPWKGHYGENNFVFIATKTKKAG